MGGTDDATAAVKAAALVESLPWVRRYAGQVVVVKFGGNAMVDDELARDFAADMVYLRSVGVRPVVVHGGGPQITAALADRGIDSEFRGGYRVTSTAAVEVVRDVLVGDISAGLVRDIAAHGDDLAVAVPGDAVLAARRKRVEVDGDEVDLGRVGEVERVDPATVLGVLDRGGVPVVSSVAESLDELGTLLNVNADDAAGAIAAALGARKLVMLTDVPGLLREWPDESTLIERLAVSELEELLPGLASGMIPKMTACRDAVRAGVGAATVIDGRVPHAVLLEIFTRRGVGTEVVPDARPTADTYSAASPPTGTDPV